MYAIGGIGDLGTVQRSVEVCTTNSYAWIPRADIHLCRYSPGNNNNYFSKKNYKIVLNLNYVFLIHE